MTKGNNNPADSNFLGRWSRRKVRAKTAPLPDTEEEETADQYAVQPTPGQHVPGRMITDAPIDPDSEDKTDDAKLATIDSNQEKANPAASNQTDTVDQEDIAKIDIDALDAESDYTRFMGDNVPEHIRAKALKKLWSSDPLFAKMDLLDEYAEDFTDAVWVVDNLRTSYRVGRGFLSDEEVAEWEELGADSKPKPDASEGPAPDLIGAISVNIESAEQPAVIAMLKASDELHNELSPTENSNLMPVADLIAANVRFVVARLGGRAAGCCALVLGNEDYAEIRRLWVVPQARRKGVASRLVSALEDMARNLNIATIRLRTDNKKEAAINFYRAAGYHEGELFGSYEQDPGRIFMKKSLS